jgi:hypothetical protein
MVKRRNIGETIMTEEVVVSAVDDSESTIDYVSEAESEYSCLAEVAQKIGAHEDVIGYILRNDSKATIDLDDQDKLVEYALLSTQAFESSSTFADEFGLGQVDSILVEGQEAKVLCVNLGENKLSIIMERFADADFVLKEFSM